MTDDDLSKFLDYPDEQSPERKPSYWAWFALIVGAITAPIWLPLGFLWAVLRAFNEAAGDALFRFKHREEFKNMPAGPSEPRYSMRVERADGTEMHFLLSKKPTNLWVREPSTENKS